MGGAFSGETEKSSDRTVPYKMRSSIGLEKAVEVLDTLGSSMSNLNPKGGFVFGVASRRNRISILAFEVANTIAKGANLFQSLSEENVRLMKDEILLSEGVQKLVSTDMKELLMIAAADKRKEFEVFAKEVIRFGDLCYDPQWHDLDRSFSKLDSEPLTLRLDRKEAETTMQELTTLVQHTSELYRECAFQGDIEQRYMQLLDLSRKGEFFFPIEELKQQRKLVRSLKKTSLWSKHLEEIIKKLVDMVHYLHQAILEAFGNNEVANATTEDAASDLAMQYFYSAVSEVQTYGEHIRQGGYMQATDIHGVIWVKNPQGLGTSGLALHYAKIINQIDNIVSWPTSVPPNTRDSLYEALPNSVKAALRSQLPMAGVKEELTITEVKAEIDKTLRWLVPIATNTTKMLQSFGWIGEWANHENEFGNHSGTNGNLIHLMTLYHADKQKTDRYIFELVIWLHVLIYKSIQKNNGFKYMPKQFATSREVVSHTEMHQPSSLNHVTQLTEDDQNLLASVRQKRMVPGISKSQEFSRGKYKKKFWEWSRSSVNSPIREFGASHSSFVPLSLDVMDGLDCTIQDHASSCWE